MCSTPSRCPSSNQRDTSNGDVRGICTLSSNLNLSCKHHSLSYALNPAAPSASSSYPPITPQQFTTIYVSQSPKPLRNSVGAGIPLSCSSRDIRSSSDLEKSGTHTCMWLETFQLVWSDWLAYKQSTTQSTSNVCTKVVTFAVGLTWSGGRRRVEFGGCGERLRSSGYSNWKLRLSGQSAAVLHGLRLTARRSSSSPKSC